MSERFRLSVFDIFTDDGVELRRLAKNRGVCHFPVENTAAQTKTPPEIAGLIVLSRLLMYESYVASVQFRPFLDPRPPSLHAEQTSTLFIRRG